MFPLQVTTNLLTRGGKDIAFSDYSPLWKSHRRLVHNSFTLFGEGTSRLQDIGTLLHPSIVFLSFNPSTLFSSHLGQSLSLHLHRTKHHLPLLTLPAADNNRRQPSVSQLVKEKSNLYKP